MSNQAVGAANLSSQQLQNFILVNWNETMMDAPLDPDRHSDRVMQMNYEITRLLALAYRKRHGRVLFTSWANYELALNRFLKEAISADEDLPVSLSVNFTKFRRKALIAADLANELKARNLASIAGPQEEFY